MIMPAVRRIEGCEPKHPAIVLTCLRNEVPKLGDVAQLVEHLLCKQKVVGSIPIVSTNKAPGSRAAGGFLVAR